jgi:hypothetical protein
MLVSVSTSASLRRCQHCTILAREMYALPAVAPDSSPALPLSLSFLALVNSFFSSTALATSAACARSGNALASMAGTTAAGAATGVAEPFFFFLPILTPSAVSSPLGTGKALVDSCGVTVPNWIGADVASVGLACSAWRLGVAAATGSDVVPKVFFRVSQAFMAGGGAACRETAGTTSCSLSSSCSLSTSFCLGRARQSSSRSALMTLVGAVLDDAVSADRFGEPIEAVVVAAVSPMDGDGGVGTVGTVGLGPSALVVVSAAGCVVGVCRAIVEGRPQAFLVPVALTAERVTGAGAEDEAAVVPTAAGFRVEGFELVDLLSGSSGCSLAVGRSLQSLELLPPLERFSSSFVLVLCRVD